MAAQIQEALHNWGIRSITIQSEYATPGIAPVEKVRLRSSVGPACQSEVADELRLT